MRHSDDLATAIIKNLVAHKVFTPQQGNDIATAFAQRESNESFEYFLLNRGFVQKDDLLKALSAYYKVPAFDTQGVFFEPQYLHMFPKDTMLRNNFIPFSVEDEIMTIVASNPNDPELPEIINHYVSYALIFVVGLETDIDDAIKEYYDDALTIDPEIIDDAESDDEKTEHELLDEITGISHPHNDYEE